MRVTSFEAEDIGPFGQIKLTFATGTNPLRADTVLIVGPNGSGKTTILSAMADCFSEDGLGPDRFRSDNGRVKVVVEHMGVPIHLELRPFTAELSHPDEWTGSKNLRLQSSFRRFVDVQRKFGSTAHAFSYSYSGTRTLQIETSRDPGDFGRFADWVGDILARRDRASVKGDNTAASDLAEGLALVESFLSEVTGHRRTFDRRLDNGQIVLVSDSEEVPLDVLPEGIKSILSWIGDLLQHLYRVGSVGLRQNELPFVLLLDEIDVHLHPKWQRLIVPAIENLFPNAQIFLSTHSPFVLASATDSQIIWLDEGGVVRDDVPTGSLRGVSYPAILELMGVTELQDSETQKDLDLLDELASQVRKGNRSMSDFDLFTQRLPNTEDVALIVDFQRSQLLARAAGSN
jgi:predicted ATP-binding protein involved in virulence